MSTDPVESFKLFQGRILEQYENMIDEFGLTVIDATKPIHEQQQEVRAIVRPHLAGLERKKE